MAVAFFVKAHPFGKLIPRADEPQPKRGRGWPVPDAVLGSG